MTRRRPPTWMTTAAGWVGGKVAAPIHRLVDKWDDADTELASAIDRGWQAEKAQRQVSVASYLDRLESMGPDPVLAERIQRLRKEQR